MGSLYKNDPKVISVQVLKELLSDYDKNDVDMTIIGNVLSAGLGQSFFRKIAIDAGIPIEKPSYSVNMVCGSGMLAIINGIKEIECGVDLVVAGGLEFMSNVPFAADAKIRSGNKMGNISLNDMLVTDGLTDAFSDVHMGVTAENIAEKYGISREEQDVYAWNALQKAINAVDEGRFKEEIVPVMAKDGRGKESVFSVDEHPNRQSSYEKIASLRPSFIQNGTVTAANSSGINDGVSFVLLCSEDYLKKHGFDPLAKITGFSMVGLDPAYMGLGPYYAIKKLIEQKGCGFDSVDVFEINEAFSAQVLGCIKLLAEEFGVSEDYIISKLNLNGSGLGLGHPLGSTGSRITVSLAHIMKKQKFKRGIASLCVGGGQGVALMLERE